MKAIVCAVFALTTLPLFAVNAKADTRYVWDEQITSPNKVSFYPSIISTKPDSNGYIYVFTYVKQRTSKSAQAIATKAQAACNATGDASCVEGQPNWSAVMYKPIYR